MKLEINKIYVRWGFFLAIFIVIMMNLYCQMVYGYNLVYMMMGKNEISSEEKVYLRQRGTLIYGETIDSFPAQIYDPELRANEDESGFAVDLKNQLALEMETKIDFKPLLWPEVFKALESGKVDIIQISYTKERAEKYYLTAPIYKSKGVVFLRNENKKIDKLKGLYGKKIAGIKEDHALQVLKKKVPKLEILEFDSIAQCAEALKQQKVEGIVADEQNIMYYAQAEKMFQNYYILPEAVYQADVVFAVRKSDEKLGKIMDKAVYKLRNQDVLNKLQQKWFLSSILDSAVSARKYYAWGIAFSLWLSLFFAYLFWYIYTNTKELVIERTKELNQKKLRLEAVLHAIPQYLFEVTADGTISMSNQKKKKQLIFCDKGNKKMIDSTILGMIQDVQLCKYLQKEITIDKKWFRITCNSIEKREKNNNVILLIEDITLYRLQMQQNIQNDKMAAIGQLAAGVSHELKNPLEIICNYCYALKMGILHTKEDIEKMVGIIEEEAKNANKIVENLLSFARITPKEICETELKPVLQTILKLQQPLLRKKGVELEFICQENISVKCNPESLKIIMINLLTNAQQAMDECGGKIKVVAIKENSQIKIEVEDTGKGMSKQEIEQIFNPFYTTKSYGTGLGLYLVYNQIKENHGTVQVYSQKGQGTAFQISFPSV